jgi:hypothetical protein
MAFIDIDGSDPVNHASFYNVGEAIGYGCKNLAEDVKVVQFFLKRIYLIKDLRNLKPWGEMAVDGKVGPITRAWIMKYQIDCRNNGANTMVDGIVNTAGNSAGNYTASISNTIYTIRMLNIMLRKLDTIVYKTLTTNQEVPLDMRLIFSKIQAQGPPMNYASNN